MTPRPTPDFLAFQKAAAILSAIAEAATCTEDLPGLLFASDNRPVFEKHEMTAHDAAQTLLATLSRELRNAVKPPDACDMDNEFTRFHAACQLLAEASTGAEDWQDYTMAIENAFDHPLYDENRVDFAMALGQALTDGVERALE